MCSGAAPLTLLCMDSIRRGTFEQMVRGAFDPVVAAYGFSLTPQSPEGNVEQRRAAAVYETSPAKFTRRFPRWSARWDFDGVGCVDLWIVADLATNRVDVHLEGENLKELADGAASDAARMTTRLEDALADEAALCALVLASHASG